MRTTFIPSYIPMPHFAGVSHIAGAMVLSFAETLRVSHIAGATVLSFAGALQALQLMCQ
jgi:hypothetical protein